MSRPLLMLLLMSGAAWAVPPSVQCVAESPRSSAVSREFQRQFPCPSTGRKSGACPGWVKDHVHSLCTGGRDSVCNLAWQTRVQAQLKDHWENTLAAPRFLDDCARNGGCFANWPRAGVCN